MKDIFCKMKEYNKLVVRFKMAAIYLDSPDTENEVTEPHIQRFQDLTKSMDKYWKLFKKDGIEFTDVEVMEGFNVEFRIARYEKYNY